MAVAEPIPVAAAPRPVVRPGFWERLIAYLVDYQIVSAIVQLVTLPATLGQFFGQLGSIQRGVVPARATPPDLSGASLGILLLVLYFVWFWSGLGGGRTWGMRVMGLRVTHEDGSSLSIVRSVIRLVGLILSFVVFAIGVIWLAFDPKKQGWHDKMAGSVVAYAGTPALFSPHPLTVTIAPTVAPDRIWAFPVQGFLGKVVVLFPVLFAQVFAATGAALISLITWVPVLIVGRYPEWAFTYIRGLMRWSVRSSTFYYGLNDRFPWVPSGLGDPAQLALERPTASTRLWAIPVVSFVIKVIVALPALALSYFAAQGLGLAFFILWGPVLFTGRYPEWGQRFVQRNLTWGARMQAFLLGLTDAYPDVWNWER
jgi:uncharacterized RDD family membrane protein YckC